MSKTADRQAVLTAQIADHLLAEGLGAASLRTIAAAVGTSDRMLLHYFPDKAALMAAALGEVARRMASALDQVAIEPMPFASLVAQLWAVVKTPDFKPYMRLWIEVAAAAGRDEGTYRQIASEIASGFTAWAAGRINVEDDAERQRLATLLLATIDGLALLDAIGLGDAVDAAVAGGGTLAHISI